MSVEKLQDSSIKDSFDRSYMIRVGFVILIALVVILGLMMFLGDDSPSVTGDEDFTIQYTDVGIIIAQTTGEPVGAVEVEVNYHNTPTETVPINIESLNDQEIVMISEEIYQIEYTEIKWSDGDTNISLQQEFLPEEHTSEGVDIDIDQIDLRVGESEILDADNHIHSDIPIESYEWDIPEYGVNQDQTIGIEYDEEGVHSAELAVSDSVGDQESEEFQIVVESPTLIGDYNVRSQANIGETVEFDASPFTTDEVTGYSWDISGNQYNSDSVQHTFTSEGIKDVKLTVEDSFGYTETVTDQIMVADSFSVDIQIDHVSDNQVILTADTEGQGTSFDWNFGDGQTTTTATPNVVHEYESSGEYMITLSVNTEDGRTEVESRQVDVAFEDDDSEDDDDNESNPDTVEIEMDEPTNNDWAVSEVHGTSENNVIPNDNIGDYNPDIQMIIGTEYTIKGLSSENPFELRDMFGDPMLSQEVTTSFEDSDEINWQDNGSEVSFTFTEDLSEWVDGYQSYSERANMDGDIIVVE